MFIINNQLTLDKILSKDSGGGGFNFESSFYACKKQKLGTNRGSNPRPPG